MPISNSYPRGIPIEDQDLFVGTKAYNNRTVNYTAQGVADYLNINSKVAIGGQMSFQFTIVPNIPKTIAFEGGFGNNTAFSAITKLIVSAMDLSTANITIFLNYLNNSQVLLSQQNQPNFFGHYKIVGYTQIGTSAFYELDLEFIGGNGTIIDKQYYDLISFVLSTEIPATEWGSITGDIEDHTDLIEYISSQVTTPTLQEVTDEGNFTDKSIYVTDALGNYLILGQEGSTPSLDFGLTIWDNTTGAEYSQYFIGRMSYQINGDYYLYLMPDSPYPTGIGIKRLATTDDITTPTLQQVLDNNHDLVGGNLFAGTDAGDANTGYSVIAIGSSAGFVNSGDNVNAVGEGAAYINTGSSVNAFGVNAATGNDGNNVNAFGNYAGDENTFSHVNLFGENANADEDGQTVLSKDGSTMARISTSDLTATRKYSLPDADGTLALTSDIQSVGFEQNFLLMGS